MRCIRYSGAHSAPLRWSGVLVVAALAAGAIGACAQAAGLNNMPIAPESAAHPDAVPSPPVLDPVDSANLAQGAHRDAAIGLAGWDHTLLGAFELGERLVRLADASVDSASATVLRPRPADPAANLLRYSGSAGRPTLDSIAKALRIDQLQRQGMNLHMSSPFGNFRLTYREIFSGRANSLGGGVGQASAAATYTTPRFGSGGLMDFSAAALMGNGPINQLLGSGFGSSLIGGNGPALRKSQGPTVAVKFTF